MQKTRICGRNILSIVALGAVGILLLAACAGPQVGSAQPTLQDHPTPEGRIIVVNQDSNTLSLIDVAKGGAYGTLNTGKQPHHVVATPDGKELWVTLYGENRLQVFDAQTLQEIASVDVGAPNDDLVFDPEGKRLYVSLGKQNAIAVIDVAGREHLQTVKVGRSPHGVRVTPDGKYLLVTNTADNTLSVVRLQPDVAVEAAIKTGANPFEVITSDDGATAYVSNFLGDSISVVDLAARKTTGFIRSGKQPAMLAFDGSAAGQKRLWVANAGSSEVWVLDPTTRKLVTKVPVGKGAHGVMPTPSGKIFVTNSADNTVTVIDQAQAQALHTLPVGGNPNGLTYVPNVEAR